MTAPGLIYRGLGRLRGPYAAVDGVPGAAFHEMVELDGGDGRTRAGQVVAVYEQGVTIEVFGPTQGLTLDAVGIRFLGHPPRVGVGPEVLGRVLDSLGRPRDGMPAPLAVEERPLDGLPLNPYRRDCPRECLETGFSAIDGLNTLTLGQKLPIFTQSGLPHDRIAAAILAQARAPGVARFAIVFAGLGLPREVAAQYETAFRRSGSRAHSVMVLSLADESATERVMAPRTALTIAEYLAWDLGLHVLVILTDITNYGEALREVASARGEVPSRKGYPGYLYSDLASLFERAGRIRGRPGSITQVPIVTLPSGDMTHPIPDLTGYVTEGQIVLDPRLYARGVYPPVAVLPSLSRLMAGGIGAGRTREDHRAIANLLYAGCAAAERARGLEAIVGTEELTPREHQYLAFADAFERRFVSQADESRRTIETTLDVGWSVAAELPPEDLARVHPDLAAKYLRGREERSVTGAATRWRLIELQRQRRALDTGIELLDRKREGLLRALAERARAASALRRRLAGALGKAHDVLDRALVEIGEAPARAATLGQPRAATLTVISDAVVGVRVDRLVARFETGPLPNGPGGTCAALDDAVRAFAALLPDVVRLAEEDGAERSLKRGLRRTTRTLNALKTVLLPAVAADMRTVASALEEEEREEAVRWRAGRS